MKILLIGDTHIPDRAYRVPRVLLSEIEGYKWDIVVFTGDLTGREVLDWLKKLSSNTYIVRGNMDYLPLPKNLTFEAEGFRIGVHHGDGVYPRGDVRKLSSIAEKLGVNILMSGHTHSPFVALDKDRNILHLNPGSLTGVWGGGDASMIPSMMIVELRKPYVYATLLELIDENISRKSYCFEYQAGFFKPCHL
ncbi:YfcE family phosphodiesterase [Thermogladius sp. 4427co]|uniref:YfcE family phosphodiesterase n=1 Tax=Thermogladius sp. 4427co TaxID=3450718 RepID=UPI003F798A7E